MKFSDAVEGAACSPATARRLRHDANRWVRHSEDPDLREISSQDLLGFRRSCLAEGLSPVTIESTISSLLCVCRQLGIFLQPGSRLRRNPPQPFVPSQAAIGAIYAASGSARWPQRSWVSCADWWRALLVISFWTGFRRGDLSRLAWQDIHTDRISLVAAKTGYCHQIPVCPVVQRHLALLVDSPREIFDLPASSSFRAFGDQLERLCQTAAVPSLTLQGIRRAAISNWSATNAEAGRIVHGCGLGVLGHYLDRYGILAEAAAAVRMPEQFMTCEDRRWRRRNQARLLTAYQQAAPDRQALILATAEALSSRQRKPPTG